MDECKSELNPWATSCNLDKRELTYFCDLSTTVKKIYTVLKKTGRGRTSKKKKGGKKSRDGIKNKKVGTDDQKKQGRNWNKRRRKWKRGDEIEKSRDEIEKRGDEIEKVGTKVKKAGTKINSNLSSAFEDPTARRWSSCTRQKNSSNLNQHGGGAKAKTIGWQGAQHLSRRNQYLHLQVDFTASCCCGKRRGFGNVVDGTMGHGFEK